MPTNPYPYSSDNLTFRPTTHERASWPDMPMNTIHNITGFLSTGAGSDSLGLKPFLNKHHLSDGFFGTGPYHDMSAPALTAHVAILTGTRVPVVGRMQDGVLMIADNLPAATSAITSPPGAQHVAQPGETPNVMLQAVSYSAPHDGFHYLVIATDSADLHHANATIFAVVNDTFRPMAVEVIGTLIDADLTGFSASNIER